MKKTILLLLLLLNLFSLFSQDTINRVKNFDGSQSFWLVTKNDTLMVHLYPNGKKESQRPLVGGSVTGIYQRWYENGQLMWSKELVKNSANGRSVYYNRLGKKVAELSYTNGLVTDTIFIKKDVHVVFGKITYSSVIYGGMVREDGTSNISESTGKYAYFKMSAVLVDNLKKPLLIEHFTSDFDGDFFFVSPKGKVGFFPAAIPLNSIKKGQFCEENMDFSSGHTSWNIFSPLEVNHHPLLYIQLQQSSVGYAP